MSQSPYAQVGPRLVQLGYSAIPIAEESKSPGRWDGKRWYGLDEWSRFCVSLPTEKDIERWLSWPDAGVGVCLGPASGVVVVDFDNRPDVWPVLEKLIPVSPVRKRGEKGYSAFYRYTGQVKRQVRFRPKDKPIVEILSLGQQTVIPPTNHPTTKNPYVWDGESLLSFPRDKLPVLPDDIFEQFCDALGIKPEIIEHTSRIYEIDDVPSLEMIGKMLACMDSSCERRRWFRTGAAIKSAYPGEDGFAAWNNWSAQSEKYVEKEMVSQWRSFRPERGITIGTLYHYSMEEGFNELDYDRDKALAGVSGELLPKREAPAVITDRGEGEPRINLTIPDEMIFSAPGLVGDITRWIHETAIRPQPVLALGAAITAVAVLKGHRYATETDLRTNIYALGVAKSGAGKDHTLRAIRHLFAIAGCDATIGGDPGSQEGLCAILQESKGRSLLLWDEIGQDIGAMTNANTGQHYSGILKTFTKFFSEAASFHVGKVLASMSRDSIEQPCLCVYGVTVPDILFDSMSSAHAVDGFLARWLLFQANPGRPRKRKGRRDMKPPVSIEDRIRALGAPVKQVMVQRKSHDGKEFELPKIVPKVIPFSDGARRMMDDLDDEFDMMADLAEEDLDGCEAIWLRAGEHIAKLALVVSDGGMITETELGWATKLVRRQCSILAEAIAERIGQNNTERNLKRVLRIIKDAGPDGLTATAFNRQTQWLSLLERGAIVETLIDSGQIHAPIDKTKKGRGPKPSFYRVL